PESAPPKVEPAYIVAFGGRDPRKRTDEVLEVLRAVDGVRLRLLTAGGLPEGFTVRAAPELAAGRLELVGHVSRTVLLQVLGGACALLYPSASEGFGLPVLEAMAAGTPAVTGLAPSTREVGG